jgi:DNA mismatch endonuclease (patch repair protein)
MNVDLFGQADSDRRDSAGILPQVPSSRIRAVMRGNRRTNTRPELLIRRALHRSGRRYRVDYPVATANTKVRPDIVFTRQKVAVFIDGCFWHGCPQHYVASKSAVSYWDAKLQRNKERDRVVTQLLSDDGWRVVRIWEHVPVDDARDAITALLDHLDESMR